MDVAHPREAMTVAPVFAVNMMSPFPAAALLTRRVTWEMPSASIVAAVPASVALTRLWPYPKRFVPVIITLVPLCPLLGVIVLIRPVLLYVHKLVPRITKPKSFVIKISPDR